MRVIGWEANLDTDEMPPEWMWPFPDDLELWFEDVKQARKERFSGGQDDNDDDDMVENELAPRRARRR